MGDADGDVEMKQEEVKPELEMDQPIPESAPAVLESAPAAEAPEVPPNPLVTQYNEQWTKVFDSPNDFTAWTNLISTVEKLDDLERLRGVYGSFLTSYPLCYGYWKKFADAESRHQNVEAALDVYERGVGATPYSVDLWGHYAIFKKNNGGSQDDVRGIYERGLAYCGTEYLGHQLWDKYIHYEEEQGIAPNVVALYCRAISCPLRELSRYMASLKAFIQGRTSAEFMSQEESTSIMDQLTAVKQAQADKAREEAANAPPEKMDEAAAAAAALDTTVSDEEVKAAWLAAREPGLEAAKKLAEARRPFEEGIKRNYFHVKVLDTPQLTNWVRYLDFMEAQQPEDLAATVTTYERCLVPCANYSEMWIRYVGYLESKGMKSEAEAALQRAVTVFCRARPEMLIFAARFEERRGNVEVARQHFQKVLTSLAPNLLAGIAAAANFERRQGKISDACAIWESALEREKAGGGNGNNNSKLYAYMAMHFATFLHEVAAQPDRARAVLKDALGVAPYIRNLWEAAIHLELSIGGPNAYARVAPLFECACAEPPAAPQDDGASVANATPLGLSEKDREELSERHVDIADEYGDAEALQAAITIHAHRFTLPSSFAAAAAAATDNGTGRKRGASEVLTGAEASNKTARADVTSPAAAASLPPPPTAAAAAHSYHAYQPAPAAAAAAAAAYSAYSAPAYGHYGYAYPSQPYASGYGYGY